MKIKTIDTIYTILGLLFIPLMFLLIYLSSIAKISGKYYVFGILIYLLMLEIIGVYTLPLSNKRKAVIIMFDVLTILFFFCFYILNYFLKWSSLFATTVYVYFLVVCIILSGIVGLLTNTFLITRGKPLVYKENSILGIIGNCAIIVMGLVLFIFTLKN